MAGWHHPFNGPEFEQAPGIGDGQGGQVCCNPWVAKNRTPPNLTEWMKKDENKNMRT